VLSGGATLGPYEVVSPLGAGGMGEVYRARDTKLGREVALKVLPEGALTDDEARRRFRKEADALARLAHPHIATIHDFDSADGTDFLVMELVRGPSLRDELEEKGALPEKTVVRLGTQLARGLQAAHEEGIVHRDLKPSNVQLTPDGLVKILDFGLAQLLPREAAGEETAPTETVIGKGAGVGSLLGADREDQILMKIFFRYIQRRIHQKTSRTPIPRRTGSKGGPSTAKGAFPRWMVRLSATKCSIVQLIT